MVVFQHHSIFYPYRLPFLSLPIRRMATPDCIRAHQVTGSFPPNIAPIQAGETQNLLRLRRDAYSLQNAPPSYPRIPRLVSKNAKSATSTPDSLFQVSASHLQNPLSLIDPVKLLHSPNFFFTCQLTACQNECAEKRSPVSAVVRRSAMFQDEKYVSDSNSPTSGRFLLMHRRPGDCRRCVRRMVLINTSLAGAILPPQRRMRDCALASGTVGPQHQRIVTTKILSTLTTSFLCLLPRGKLMITAPVARSPLLFFPHLTDSAFYASAHPRRPSSFRKFAMRKAAAGDCAFPRAGCPRIWSTCSKSSRNWQSNWARRCRR